ncbi:MAG TPA: hypothetical protein VGJ05_02915 [Fimbriiglobus sp.]
MTRIFIFAVVYAVAGSPAFGQVVPPIPPIPSLPKATVPDEPPDSSSGTDDNPLKIAERAITNAKDATEKLAMLDAGDGTQAAQKRTLKAIDDLLKKSENPPPPPMSGEGSPPPPMGGGQPPPPMGGGKGGSGSPPPMGGGQPPPPMGGGKGGSGSPPPMGNGGKPMGGQQPKGGQPQAGRPMGGQQSGGQARGGNSPGQGGAKSPPGVPLPEKITKDVWGHLPPQLRQQMSQFYREHFMPKYSELLRQYYSSLAEKEKEKK